MSSHINQIENSVSREFVQLEKRFFFAHRIAPLLVVLFWRVE
jgi:hypothetical protein